MITKATTADTAALTSLVNSAYRGEGSKQGWTTEADLLDCIRTDEAAIKSMDCLKESTWDFEKVYCFHRRSKFTSIALDLV